MRAVSGDNGRHISGVRSHTARTSLFYVHVDPQCKEIILQYNTRLQNDTTTHGLKPYIDNKHATFSLFFFFICRKKTICAFLKVTLWMFIMSYLVSDDIGLAR